MEGLRDAIDVCGLADLSFEGSGLMKRRLPSDRSVRFVWIES
jgi:hypothetical protein